MTEAEYKELVQRVADISKQLTELLDEEGQELFEAYCEIYEKMILNKAARQA